MDLGLAAVRIFRFEVEAVDTGGLWCTMDVEVTVEDRNMPHSILNLPKVVQFSALTSQADEVVRRLRA